MASVVLNRVWVAAASNLAVAVVAGSGGFPASGMGGGGPAGTDTRTGAGAVRRYAGGRFRNVTVAGVGRKYSMTLRMLDGPTVSLLEGWINQTVLVRDSTGRRVWGVYNALGVFDYPGGVTHDVAYTLVETTYSEAV